MAWPLAWVIISGTLPRAFIHLGLSKIKTRPLPKADRLQPNVLIDIDYSDSQVPPWEKYLCCDSEYPIEV